MFRKVLHVDDEPDVRHIAYLALSEIGGLEVCTCAGGTEALQRLPEFQPDMVLVDSMMPNMSGEQTVRAIRAVKEFRRVPVVFLTAVERRDVEERSEDLGLAGVIQKPFDPVTLSEQLRVMWLASNGSPA